MKVELLETVPLCLHGFARDTAPVLEVTSPDGARRRLRWKSGIGMWGWYVQPGAVGEPVAGVGVYRFMVTGRRQRGGRPGPAGDTVVSSGSLVVAPGIVPRAAIAFRPTNGQDATAVVKVAGFRPGSTVFVSAYTRRSSRYYRWIADLPDVSVSRDGAGTVQWSVPTAASPGTYGIWVSPTPKEPVRCRLDLCDVFTVEAESRENRHASAVT